MKQNSPSSSTQMSAADFMRLWWPGDAVTPERKIATWAKRGGSRYWDDIDAAGAYLAAADVDTYVQVCLVRPGLSPRKRGTAADTVAIGALWLDIDTDDGHAGKSRKAYPPDKTSSLSLARAITPEFSALVASGGGYQAWWILDHVHMLDAASRDQWSSIARRWNAKAQVVAAASGWTIDSVFDLARLMRVPGTANHKYSPPRPVEVVEMSARRHTMADMIPLVMRLKETAADDGHGHGHGHDHVADKIHLVGQPSAMVTVMTAVRDDPQFARTWNRRRSDMTDQSGSSYDLAIANYGVRHSWSDSVIGDAIGSHRTMWTDQPEKARRRDYIDRTIAKARESSQVTSALQAVVDTPPTTPQDAIAEIAKIMQIDLERIVCHHGDARKPTYSLELKSNQSIMIGTSENFMNVGAVKARLFDCGVVAQITRAAWAALMPTVRRAIEDVVSEDATPGYQLQTLIAAYCSAHATRLRSEDQDLTANVDQCYPVIVDRRICLHGTTLIAWSREQRQAMMPSEIWEQFRIAGWCEIRFQNKRYRQEPSEGWVSGWERLTQGPRYG